MHTLIGGGGVNRSDAKAHALLVVEQLTLGRRTLLRAEAKDLLLEGELMLSGLFIICFHVN
jgi:hypothetical protein